MKTLDAAVLGIRFGEFLEKVHSLGASFKIVKKGIPYGYLVPAEEPQCNSHQFAEALEQAEIPDAEHLAHVTALRNGHRALKPLKNPWG